jgi:hypothetical protein
MKYSKWLLLLTIVVLIIGDNLWTVFNDPAIYYKAHSLGWFLITVYCVYKEKYGEFKDIIFAKGFNAFKIALCFFLLAGNDLIVEFFFDGTKTEVNAYVYLLVVIVYLVSTARWRK